MTKSRKLNEFIDNEDWVEDKPQRRGRKNE